MQMQIERTFKHIQVDWSTITDSSEIEILTKYTYAAYIVSLTIYSKIIRNGFIKA